jgi:hypothetical protein
MEEQSSRFACAGLDAGYENILKATSRPDRVGKITNKKLKLRIPRLFLRLISRAGASKEGISPASHWRCNLPFFEFGDELDEVTLMAGELELPGSLIEDDAQVMWQRMRAVLETYVGG